jgi:hypothetical protein
MKNNTTRVREDVTDVNKNLKVIRDRLGSPKKFCCDIILCIVLAIMIGALVWAIRFYMSLDTDDI